MELKLNMYPCMALNPKKGGGLELPGRVGGQIRPPHVKMAFRTVFANFFHTTHQMYIQ
jgi:hypothetical protein